jgi:hypothetical protein
VRKTEDIRALRTPHRGLGKRLNRHPDAIQHFSNIPSVVRNLPTNGHTAVTVPEP